MNTINALDGTLRTYLSPDQSNQVKRAYFFAEQAHHGQFRRSGEPYVTHPLAVAGILAEMHMDHQSLMAAMLHDVIEDTGIDKSAIERHARRLRAAADLAAKVQQVHRMADFPPETDPDLMNEHWARYRFAESLVHGKRV